MLASLLAVSLVRSPGVTRQHGKRGLRWAVEVSGHLVVPPVFKTGEAEHLGLAGSIPVHLRQHDPSARVVTEAVREENGRVAGGSTAERASHRRPARPSGPRGRSR